MNMGYLSDVGLCLSYNGKCLLDHNIFDSDGQIKASETFKLLEDAEKREHESGDVAYFWSDIKWHYSFIEVKFFEDLMINLSEEDYLFIRLGESNDDIDHRGGYWNNPFNMHLTRSIVFDS
jgi:hypothetical protein